MQSVLRMISIAAVIGVLLIALACQNEGNSNALAVPNQNVAAPAQTSENQNRAIEIGNTNSSTEQVEASSEDFEGTAGIVEKKKPNSAPVLLRSVRAAQQEKFDRVVFEFSGRELPSYHIEYVNRPVRRCGSGEAVRVAGAAWLLVRLKPANAHTESGELSIEKMEFRYGMPNLKDLKLICDFEAEVSWVLGFAHPNRYRVLELANPARLVIDVKH